MIHSTIEHIILSTRLIELHAEQDIFNSYNTTDIEYKRMVVEAKITAIESRMNDIITNDKPNVITD